jgi:hypothetical protein
MGTSVTLVKQFGNPTFNSLRVSGSIFFTGSLNISGSVTATSNLVVSGSGSFVSPIKSTYNTGTGITDNVFSIAKTVLGNIHINNGAGAGSNNNNQAAITFQGNNTDESQAGIYILNNNSNGTYMGFATTDSYAAGPKLFMTATNLGNVSLPRGSLTAAGNVTAYSDRRVKENIKTIDNALSKVLALRGVTYNRIDIEDKSEQIGVIAQEIKEILPQVVQENEGHYSVAYGNIVGVLIEAIKEQQAQIEELKSRL